MRSNRVGSGVAGEGVVQVYVGEHLGGNGHRGACAEGVPQVGPEGQRGQLLGGPVSVGDLLISPGGRPSGGTCQVRLRCISTVSVTINCVNELGGVCLC